MGKSFVKIKKLIGKINILIIKPKNKKYSEMSDTRLLKRHHSNKSKKEKIDKKIKSSKIEYSKENEKENQNEKKDKKEKSLIKIILDQVIMILKKNKL